VSGSQQDALVAPIPHRGAHAARTFGYLLPFTRAILAWALRCAERSAQRRTLTQMTDWQLRDIGISRAEADGEAGKWCWRP
jgi:uncharacterized protein YjiS (DUF1127 family)